MQKMFYINGKYSALIWIKITDKNTICFFSLQAFRLILMECLFTSNYILGKTFVILVTKKITEKQKFSDQQYLYKIDAACMH